MRALVKKRPRPACLARLRQHPADVCFTSTICVMELRHGSRRREHHASFWAGSTHEILARVTILDFGVPETLVAGDVPAHMAHAAPS